MQTTVDLHGPARLPDARFLSHIESEGHAMLATRTWIARDIDPKDIEAVGRLLAAYRGTSHEVFAVATSDATALIIRGGSDVRVTVAAESLASADALQEELRLLLEGETEEDEVAVGFWTGGRFGGDREEHVISAEPWSWARDTQADSQRAALDRLVAQERPDGGRLVLWHGEPGTGKTSALRSLVREWQEWCSVHYITDPEEFFAGGSSYLMDVLTEDDDQGRDWRLIVLEDAGELLTVDAHERDGQRLARLLNTTDGFLGQDANAILLITTNEPIGTLHPAVTRPGRCLAEIEFTALGIEEANAWLAERDCDVRVAQPATIAECFALLEGSVEPRPAKRYGFAA